MPVELNNDISTLAQDVSAQTGVAYSALGNTEVPEYAGYDAIGAGQSLETDAPVVSGLDYVDEDKSTVKGQLSSLLASDSPYLQQARLSGERQAQGRGLLNTSMAAGASQAEAIKAAAPIAMQDAQTFATAQGMEQQTQNQKSTLQSEAIVSGQLAKQNASIAGTDKRIQNMFTAQVQGASESSKVLFQGMQNNYNTFMTETEAQHQLLLQREDVSAKRAEMIGTQSSTIMQNYQISVENMLTDPDFLNMGAEAVNNGIAQLQQIARNSINFVGATADVDLTGFVDAYLADVDVL